MIKKFNWEAYSSKNRIEAIEMLKDSISKHDGAIMNFNMFSDLAISLSIEMEEGNISEFYKGLSQLFTVSELQASPINAKSKKDCLIFLNLSFSSGKGEMKIEIPSVPG